jgi:hypothetical protein
MLIYIQIHLAVTKLVAAVFQASTTGEHALASVTESNSGWRRGRDDMFDMLNLGVIYYPLVMTNIAIENDHL